jgi:hypothetical protein
MTSKPGLCPELYGLLERELAAGNAVRETRPAPGSVGILVLLTREFRATADALPPNVFLVSIDDPLWWKAEYHCTLHPHVLACPFD